MNTKELLSVACLAALANLAAPAKTKAMNLRNLVLKLVSAILLLLPLPASALVMRADGPEPVIVQIKESLRTSDDLDNRLAELTSLQRQNDLSVAKWWAGHKLLVMFSFPSDFTEKRALAVIAELKRLPAVEKVVAISAYNLEFKSGDFAREYGPDEEMPDVARRGFGATQVTGQNPCQLTVTASGQLPYVPNRLIVRWKEEHVWKAEQSGFLQRIDDLHRETGCRVLSEQRPSPTRLNQILEFDDPKTLEDKLQTYLDSGLVEHAQPDFIYKPAAAAQPALTPNDPWYLGSPGPQWSLPLISAPQAWGLPWGTGDHRVIIAVGDSGAPVDGPEATWHPDFRGRILQAQNYDFYDNDYTVADSFGHGTHVASIIGAHGNNGQYMCGVAWDVSLMILRVMGPSGEFTPSPDPLDERDAFSSSVSGAIHHASENGATAINLSLIGTYFECVLQQPIFKYDPLVQEAIRDALPTNDREPGMLIVAGAGNGHSSNDYNTFRHSPTSIPVDNVISVGATDHLDQRWPDGNSGRYRVDLGAPGGSAAKPTIGLSFDPGTHSLAFGTSFAAPHVSGAAALVKSKYPWENYLGIRDRILMGVDHLDNLQNTYRTKGRLNVFKALHKRTLIRNISTRARVEDGERVLIGGFVIGGSIRDDSDPAPTLKVILRGMGPSVGVSAGTDRLENPTIKLYDSSGTLRHWNDDWGTDQSRDELVSSGFQPSHESEAAMIRELDPGAYTLVVSAAPGTDFGVGLVEIYEFSGGASERSRLLNLSTRCFVGTGENAPIAGMIVGEPTPFHNPVDNPAVPDRRILMLGKGPTLGRFGVSDPLYDPEMELVELRNGSGNFIDSNDSWTSIDGELQFSQGGKILRGDALEEELVEADWFQCIEVNPPLSPEPCHHPFAPQRNYTAETQRESALWPTLRPGSYTAIFRGTNGSTGIGLIEFYEY